MSGFLSRVYFNEFNADSLNIFISYWYHPPDYWKYLEHAHWINLQIKERFNAQGIDLGFPTQAIRIGGSLRFGLGMILRGVVAAVVGIAAVSGRSG